VEKVNSVRVTDKGEPQSERKESLRSRTVKLDTPKKGTPLPSTAHVNGATLVNGSPSVRGTPIKRRYDEENGARGGGGGHDGSDKRKAGSALHGKMDVAGRKKQQVLSGMRESDNDDDADDDDDDHATTPPAKKIRTSPGMQLDYHATVQTPRMLTRNGARSLTLSVGPEKNTSGVQTAAESTQTPRMLTRNGARGLESNEADLNKDREQSDGLEGMRRSPRLRAMRAS
jgi:hypothetical protein